MEHFEEFKFNWTYHVAANIRNQIFRDDPDHLLIDIKDYFYIEKTFIQKAIKPSKFTFLHTFIGESIDADLEYYSSKIGDDFLPEWLKLLDGYDIKYEEQEDFEYFDEFESDDNYHDYIFEKVVNEVQPKIINEVFTLLFSDRSLLLEMNKRISGVIKKAKKTDYPTLLKEDGKVIRNTYWPTWLKKALVYRDKGRCAICLCDISGIMVTGKDYAIDHMVPINLGGTNDPTNLQLLCEGCNSSKGGHTITTSSKYHLYWEPEDMDT